MSSSPNVLRAETVIKDLTLGLKTKVGFYVKRSKSIEMKKYPVSEPMKNNKCYLYRPTVCLCGYLRYLVNQIKCKLKGMFGTSLDLLAGVRGKHRAQTAVV